MKTIVPSFTEPSATNNNRGSPNNNAINFPEVYESLVHKRQQGPAFFIRLTTRIENMWSSFGWLKRKDKVRKKIIQCSSFLTTEIHKTSFRYKQNRNIKMCHHLLNLQPHKIKQRFTQ